MTKIAKQVVNGKAFEYALLAELNERLEHITSVEIIKNDSFEIALKYFETFNDTKKAKFRLTASFAINFLIDIEPRLTSGINESDILELEIVADKSGQTGDVRDVLAIRALQKWEIGISAKNNHRAVKHSRLSSNIDFGLKWLSIPSSQNYFDEVNPIFDRLATIRQESNATQKWGFLGDYHTSVYVPILNAFKKELLRLDNDNPGIVAQRLVEYLIGNKDYYKVIKSKSKVEIQAFNLHGTLNLPFENRRSKAKVPKLKFPDRLIEVDFHGDSKTTLIVTMNEGWQISFRIHNASSRIEPSLKFDINLLSAPHSLFINKLFLP